VIKETIKKDLPAGFQRSEFLLEHGFLDFIVDRKDLKDKLSSLLGMLK
jgi:acetyl-CoA carboxylase carboxyl transferase subunit beta